MKNKIFFKFISIGLLGALILCCVSLFCLVRISDMMVEGYRYGYLMYISRAIEKTAERFPVEKVDVDNYPAPLPPDKDPFSLIKLTEFGQADLPESEVKVQNRKGNKIVMEKRGPRPGLWLVSGSGKILSSTTGLPLPLSWEELPKPKKLHGISSVDNVLFRPKIFTVKLNTTPETFLVSHNERTLFQGPFLWIQGIHTFTTAGLAVFLALSISFYYLRKKSDEARKVLAKLESGDLKARFKVERFDEFGNLILDFNRMADEIERLVNRVHETEATRSNLLQELGHDLRTPLTSIATSFETLQSHHAHMSDEDREELFSIIGPDVRYFKDLLDKLTIIAAIDAPQYKATTEKIDLGTLLEEELRNRKTGHAEINWIYESDEENESVIFGDPHLITRLFKNAFDNAGRYANSMVKVNLHTNKNHIAISVKDDGPGLTPAQLQAFGKRRERRELKYRDAHEFSLGLGSVIMKTIAQVHHGEVIMANHHNGACLTVNFKRP